MGVKFELTNAVHINETIGGGKGDLEFEKMLDDFLERMSHVDKKLSMQRQKKILRDSTAEAVRSLRRAVRMNYKKHTGYAIKSVRVKTAESKTQRGTVYTTFGYRDRHLPDILNTKIINRNGDYRVKPKPATYIGIWGDKGTKKNSAREVLSREWNANKERIKAKLEEAFQETFKDGYLNK